MCRAPLDWATREAWFAARLQVCRVASSTLACTGEGNNFTRTTTFMIEHTNDTTPARGAKPQNSPETQCALLPALMVQRARRFLPGVNARASSPTSR
ncbi:hypothetical protein GCM10009603_29110 [Nocardiopsis exhalans]